MRDDIKWLSEMASADMEPEGIAALAIMGLQMVEDRRALQEGRLARDIFAEKLSELSR